MHTKLKELISSIKSGVPVLTVNARLSRYIRRQYDEMMLEAGHTTWETPLIMPLPSWIEMLWNESWPEEPLLSKVRSSVLWERIVSNDELLSNLGILSAHGLARTAYDAYSLMGEYCFSFPRDEIYLTEEAKALKRWAMIYEEELKRLGFIDQVLITDKVIKLIRDKKIPVPEEMILAGFDELPPKTAFFIEAIEEYGGKITFWPYEPIKSNSPVKLPDVKEGLKIRAYTDEVEEVIQAARWARKTICPGIRIGFIVPELDRYRKLIKQEFSAELNPPSTIPWEERPDPFNISLGSTLYEEPIIKSALDILSIDEKRQDINKISSILHSPFINGNDFEYHALAGLDAELKEKNYLHISLSEIRKILDRSVENNPRLNEFKRNLEGWATTLKESRKRELPGYWAGKFSNLLKRLGWPSNGITLSSNEYQAVQAWNNLLEGLASLDDILGKVSRITALSQLTKIATDTIHQAETSEHSIQILGILEAAGQYFDHIWIMGAHENTFPNQPSPNPFIPLYLQKKLNIPHSSPERELAFSKVLLKRLLDSAPNVEVSYPLMRDEKEVRLSPLLEPLGQQLVNPILTDSSRLKDIIHSQGILENIPEDWKIPVKDDELEIISGGTSILKDQSACPFMAFALHRLNASGIAAPEPGFSAADKGSIVHTALKVFWERVRSSKSLKKIIERNSLDSIINASVNEALKGYHRSPSLPGKHIDLERERVETLINEWIDLESKRGDFEVREIESEKDITIGKLRIKARFDRTDSLNNGSAVIIDYKTGACSKNDWLTERPKEPQLLLYSLSGSFEAIAFAKVRLDDLKFIGISKDGEMIPGIKSLNTDIRWKEKMGGINNWDELMEMWKKTIEKLAEQFVNGEASANPNEYPSGQGMACDYCDLTMLCRIFELHN